MPRRVRRPADKDDLLDLLTNLDNEGVFETYKDALVFAAAVGAFHGNRESLGKSGEQIDYGIFSRRSDNEMLFSLLALFDGAGVQALKADSADERLTIFEEYANAGLDTIQYRLDQGKPPKDVVIDLLTEARNADEAEEEFNLSTLAEELGL